MRVHVALTMVVFSGVCQTRAQPEAARKVLDAAQTALGGVVALEHVRAFRAEGRSVQRIGTLTLASRVTLTVARPDGYVRTEALSIGSRSAETATGFNGDTVIQRATGPDGVAVDSGALVQSSGGSSQAATAAALRRELRLLLLGCFADSFDAAGAAVDYRGTAEAPDGKADALHLVFADNSDAILFTDVVTHLPLMVSWEAPDTLAPLRSGGRGVAVPSPSSGPSPISELPLVGHRLYFSDYRRVGEVRWPFVIRRAVNGELLEEIRFDRISINPAVDPNVFAVGR
jgi:hypothetical protein